MTDIVERLNQMRTELDHSVVNDAIAEIMRLRTAVEHLRAVAGAVSVDGQSFADIKRDIGK